MLFTALIALAAVGGFAFINTYLMIDLFRVVVYLQPGPAGPAPKDCTQYYCGDAATLYAHNYAAYQMCNRATCQDVICGSFDCGAPALLPISRYYACMGKCSPAIRNFPQPLYVVFIVGCVSGGLFGVAVIVAVAYGVVGCVCCGTNGTVGISCRERVAFLLNFPCPSAKYYAFREREDWAGSRIVFRWMLWMDMIVTALVGLALGGYIYLAVYQTFLLYEYLVTYAMALMFLAYVGNLRRNYLELVAFEERFGRIRAAADSDDP